MNGRHAPAVSPSEVPWHAAEPFPWGIHCQLAFRSEIGFHYPRIAALAFLAAAVGTRTSHSCST